MLTDDIIRTFDASDPVGSAEKMKNKGNVELQRQNPHKAEEWYSFALHVLDEAAASNIGQSDPSLKRLQLTLLSNRAMASLAQSNFGEAVESCEEGLSLVGLKLPTEEEISTDETSTAVQSLNPKFGQLVEKIIFRYALANAYRQDGPKVRACRALLTRYAANLALQELDRSLTGLPFSVHGLDGVDNCALPARMQLCCSVCSDELTSATRFPPVRQVFVDTAELQLLSKSVPDALTSSKALERTGRPIYLVRLRSLREEGKDGNDPVRVQLQLPTAFIEYREESPLDWRSAACPVLSTTGSSSSTQQQSPPPASNGRATREHWLLNGANQLASLLMVDPTTGCPPPSWVDNVGSILILRSDGLPLTEKHTWVLWDYLSAALSELKERAQGQRNGTTLGPDPFSKLHFENFIANQVTAPGVGGRGAPRLQWF